MADLLLELFSEEIPARMQSQAAKDLERLVVGALSDRGLMFESAKSFAGPRRLTLAIAGLPPKQPDVSEERKGPRVGAPEKAVEGFLRSAGVTLAECRKQSDGKGEFYVAVIARKGRATAEVLSEVLPECFAKLPWPKSMRFPGSEVRWVRPLHSILCVFDGAVVPFSFAGVQSGNQTRGHRFLSSGPLTAKTFEIYRGDLKRHHVVLDAAERKQIILNDARTKAFALGLEPIEDEGLLEEVAGLGEWPVVLIGKIEDQFMDVPAEILQTSMRTHQKYFSLRDPKTGKMANRFAVVSNMQTEDGGAGITAGNERVLRARLSDAKFFWDQDRQHRLDSRVEALKGIVFHAKLGTQYERVERVEALAGEIAAKIGAGLAEGERNKLVEKARRAARLCKADLTTGMVGEFPELQGVMGRYYALHDGEDADVADAIRDHYRPVGPSDAVPTAPVSVAVALADKLDQLKEFFRVGEKPTGSSDPFALRRAALGIVRIIVDRFRWRVSLREFGVNEELLSFFADRLEVALRDQKVRPSLIQAVFALGHEDDFVRLYDRVSALQSTLDTDDGANLLVAYRRAANILKIEEKKDKASYDGEPDPEDFVLPEEKSLFVELATAAELVKAEIARERFVEAMGVMSRLRKPVDAFFDKVTVNDKDAKLRKNRLLLLSRLRATLHLAADFSKIEG